ncbi:hypothetical protein [Haloplanus aerogenes]|uniref:Uncharacterized protein n=1 Tax=Haloplanus aerogenes TaxID=660522 RepID=A0A3M0CVG2_9EURY|nr:hypothetical protein [Haloplanus aerogenes]AZH23993.1 hypothetical protein DU502_00760 [Haloplanus aerogenes]RMB13238.1 hypothetical protein ATH50_2571 [Haloplanus aerogenes]
MVEESFTDPEETHEEWIDVRMTDPDEGEWDIDVVVVEGQVEYVDLRIKPELLAAFVDCLVEDVGDDRAEAVLSTVAERNGIDLGDSGEE